MGPMIIMIFHKLEQHGSGMKGNLRRITSMEKVYSCWKTEKNLKAIGR